MQILDDRIIDFTPPLPKRCVQEYYRHFVYQHVDAQCYVDGCHRPLMSKSYLVEKDKKANPHSSTLMYLTPWPPEENENENLVQDPARRRNAFDGRREKGVRSHTRFNQGFEKTPCHSCCGQKDRRRVKTTISSV